MLNSSSKGKQKKEKRLPWNSFLPALTFITIFETCPSTVAKSINPKTI